MANRYWVGDTGTWNDTSHWSTTSGGASGATVPGVSDVAIIDLDSFSADNKTITLDSDITVQALYFEALEIFTFTTNNFNITTSGDGIDFNCHNDYTLNLGTSTITCNNGGDFRLYNSLVVTKTITVNGSSATLNLTNGGVLTFNCTIASALVPPYVTMTGTIGTVNLAVDGTYTIYFIAQPTMTLTNLIIGSGSTVYFSNTSTYNGTIKTTNLTADGTEQSLITFRSINTGSAAALSATTASISYVDVQDNTATGSAIPFYDGGGVDSGNNTNWLFIKPTYNSGTEGILRIAPPAGTTNNPVLDGSAITATRTYTLPNTSGTIALLSTAGTVTSVATTAPLSGGPITTSGTITTSMNTNKLIGRGTAGTGVMEEITLGTNLSLSGTTLNAAGASGDITAVGDVASGAAFDGTAGSVLTFVKETQAEIRVAATTTADTAGQTLLIWGAKGKGTGSGGSLQLQSGRNESDTGFPAGLDLSGTSASSVGPNASLFGGDAPGTDQNGGSVYLYGGEKTGTGQNGKVVITGYPSFNGAILSPESLTNDRDFTFPDVAGTFAVQSGHSRATGQTAANTNVLTVTAGASDVTLQVMANVLITASTTHSIGVTVDYTDEGNTTRTLTLPFSQLAGTIINAITNVTGVGPYEGVPLTLRAKAGSTVVFKTAGTFTSVTYNVDASVVQIA